MPMKAFLFLLFSMVTFISSVQATTINVPTAQPTIQAGIDAAASNDTVLVQPGSYVENINFGKNIMLGSLFLTTGDTSYISQTVIDGDSSESVVKFENGEDSTAVLTGFTITNGAAEDAGGIYCFDSNPILNNLRISGNIASSRGGGIYLFYSGGKDLKQSISNFPDLFRNKNLSTSFGNKFSKVPTSILSNICISRNTAGRGGGLCWGFTTPTLKNVKISNNTGFVGGGGLVCRENSDLILINTIVYGNIAGCDNQVHLWGPDSRPSFY